VSSSSLLSLPAGPEYFVDKLREMHLEIRDHLLEQLRQSSIRDLSRVTEARGGDTIYGIDEKGEEVLDAFCREWSTEYPFILIAEGISGSGERVYPAGADPASARFRLIVDPIDGTRCIMYNKRSAWVLSAVAPNRGAATTMADVAVAMQTEVPTTRHYLSDVLYAWVGSGACGETHHLFTGAVTPFTPTPSSAPTIAHGFATISKFFPGGKEITARLEEAVVQQVLGPPVDGNPQIFDDQYVSSGGQLYELMIGHDRFNADLRPLTLPAADRAAGIGVGQTLFGSRLCAHPYDLCTELIAREGGIFVTDAMGRPLAAPLDIHTNVSWIGYANDAIRRQIEPVLLELLEPLRGTPPVRDDVQSR
jgi:hypothetical protein